MVTTHRAQLLVSNEYTNIITIAHPRESNEVGMPMWLCDLLKLLIE